jgi:hypothetical protein
MNGVDVDVVEQLCALLKPFKMVTVIMSTETSSSISLLRPLLHQLMEHAKPEVGDIPVIHQTKAAIYHDMEKRYGVF